MTRGLSSIKVDVVSDSVCPWCYVGKLRLQQAIKQLPSGVDVEVRWHPFQLNPVASEEGENKLDMYKAKFGAARVAQVRVARVPPAESVSGRPWG